MRLDQLEWISTTNENLKQIDIISHAYIPSGHVIWKYSDDTYDFDKYNHSEWHKVSEMDAQCILLYLLGAPHEARPT